MKFEYVGYRPIISHHGITFKQGKDDKFVYFPYVYEILNALIPSINASSVSAKKIRSSLYGNFTK